VAEDLGAEVLQLQGDIVTELTRVVRPRNVTRIVIGHSERSRLQELLHRSVVNDLLRALPDVDINVVASRPDAGRRHVITGTVTC
jgi:two-component system sensor histidine kinase KdpD